MEERGGELFSNKMFDKACGFASSALLPAPLSLSDEADSAYLAANPKSLQTQYLLTGSSSYDITDMMDQCIVLQDGDTAQVPSDYIMIKNRITLRQTL